MLFSCVACCCCCCLFYQEFGTHAVGNTFLVVWGQVCHDCIALVLVISAMRQLQLYMCHLHYVAPPVVAAEHVQLAFYCQRSLSMTESKTARSH
jgi:hypothetical protein